MTLEEMQQSNWYKGRPKVIQQAFDLMPANVLYKFKDTGYQCYIYSYDEPESQKLEDVTVVVYKTGKGGAMAKMGLGMINKNGVFGVKLSDLELWEEE